MAAVQIVDDSDPAVNYSSGWQKAGGGNEYNATTSWTAQPHTTATLAFEGIQISVIGSVGPSVSGLVSPQSNYSIDGGTPTTYSPNQDQGVHYNTKFYQSPVLPDGRHTLVITNLLASDSLYLDFFLIYKSATDPSSLISPKVSMITVTRPTTVLFTPTPSIISDKALPTSTDKPSTSGSNSTAAIAGSFFGAAVFIVLAFAAIIYLRGRNRRKREEIDDLGYPKVLDDGDPKSPFDHTAQPTFAPASMDVAQPYGTGWGAQQAHNGTYNVDTTQQHYGMAQQAQNGTYNGNTAQQHYAVNPPGLVAQQADNGPYDPYAPHPY